MATQRVQLSDAIEDYTRFRVSQGIGKATLRNQRTTLTRFLTVTGNIWVHAINDVHVTRFFEELSKTKQPQSQRNDHVVLNGFFDWARTTRRMGEAANPMYGRRKPKRVVREKNRIHVSKFPALLDAAEKRCVRDRAGVALLLYTLCRDQEIATLRIRDLELDAGYLKVVAHKTGTEDRLPISRELDQEMRSWLTYYTEQVGYLEPHYYLLPSRTTRGVQGAWGQYRSVTQVALHPEQKVSTLGRLVTPALEEVGFPIRDAQGKRMGEGSHTIRRSGARALFDRLVEDSYDGALRVVQSMLHHASVEQTERYLGITADRKTRDELLRGQFMYVRPDGVIPFRKEA